MRNVQHTKSLLKRKLNEGTLTQEDMETARECAASLQTTEAIALYSQIKRTLEATE